MCPLETFVTEVELCCTDTKNGTVWLHGNISQTVYALRESTYWQIGWCTGTLKGGVTRARLTVLFRATRIQPTRSCSDSLKCILILSSRLLWVSQTITALPILPAKSLYTFLISLTHATYRNLLWFVYAVLLCKGCGLWSSSMCTFLHLQLLPPSAISIFASVPRF